MRLLAFLTLPFVALASPALAQHMEHHDHTMASATPGAPYVSPRISVEVVGEGPDVILIPGLGSTPDVWRATVAALPGYRYHLVQVKGFAGVPAEANATGEVVHPVAGEIVRYIAENHLDHPTLVGHSMGGTIAMTVATHHPESVGKLMVVDMFPFMGALFGGPTATPESVAPIAAQVRAGIAGATGDARRAQIEQIVAGMVNTAAERPAIAAASLASDPATSSQSMYDLITTDMGPSLPRFTGPMTVLWAWREGSPLDQPTSEAFYRGAYARAPQAVVTFIPDSAHFIMQDAPARFQAELRAFLATPIATPAP
ncbi:MAG: alpha/beta hydrolase [Pseudomonadota bacterium]